MQDSDTVKRSEKRTFRTGLLLFALFLVLAWLLVTAINRTLLIKGEEKGDYNSVAQASGFYDLDRDTVDVLFLGSSHSYTSFCPQLLYDDYGIRSYNLGTSQQSIWLSYYWLKEALSYQHPKVVVLEVYYVTTATTVNGNGDEGSMQKGIVWMSNSACKREAVQTALSQYPQLTWSSFCFPWIRFHERWTEVSEEDFHDGELKNSAELKGYSMRSEQYSEEDYHTLPHITDEEWELPDITTDYLNRIVKLCNDNNIQLLLVKTPTTAWYDQWHNTVSSFAEQNDLTFYDFNEPGLYQALGYDFSSDSADYGHPNYSGSSKITGFIGTVLSRDYGIEGTKDSQWDDSEDYYRSVLNESRLQYVTDVDDYLEALQDKSYDVLIAYKTQSRLNLSDASLTDIHIIEESEGTLHNGYVGYHIEDADDENNIVCSILIDNTEYAANQAGINVVVYSNRTRQVIDSGWIEYSDEGISGSMVNR